MIWIQRLFILLSAIVLGGCATLVPSANPVQYKTFGDAETIAQRQKDVIDRFERARVNPPVDKLAQVKVLQDAVPEGIDIKDGAVSIKEGAPFTLIGKFELRRADANTFWFHDYASTWRKPYCYWQVPLTWVTLTMWQWLVPLSYPCTGNSLTRAAAIEQIKTLALVAGANLVVLTMTNHEDDVLRVEGILLHTTLETLGPSKRIDKPHTAGLLHDPGRRPVLPLEAAPLAAAR